VIIREWRSDEVRWSFHSLAFFTEDVPTRMSPPAAGFSGGSFEREDESFSPSGKNGVSLAFAATFLCVTQELDFTQSSIHHARLALTVCLHRDYPAFGLFYACYGPVSLSESQLFQAPVSIVGRCFLICIISFDILQFSHLHGALPDERSDVYRFRG
jgi:hypothetical protein